MPDTSDNSVTPLTPGFVRAALRWKQHNFSKSFKGESMNLTRFSLFQLPELSKESGNVLSKQMPDTKSTEGLFNTSQESFLGPVPVCPCVLKVVLGSLVIWVSCPSSWKNESEREEETTKGRYARRGLSERGNTGGYGV